MLATSRKHDVLRCVRMFPNGGRLRIEATNYDVSVVCHLPVACKGKGVLIPAAMLYDAVESTPLLDKRCVLDVV